MRRQSPTISTIAAALPIVRGRARPGLDGVERAAMEDRPIDGAVIERWALAYLGRFASSAENLRRVLLRRVRRRVPEDRSVWDAAGAAIDALVTRYQLSGLVDDASYAAGRARARLRRGQ